LEFVMSKKSIGVIGVGTYLPPDVRKNDYWSPDLVAKWREKKAAPLSTKVAPEAATPGARAIMEAMAAWREDPFHGALERRVLKDGMRASDMELEAARAAIANAGIDPQDIGIVLVNTLAPDFLVTNNACLLHHNLGLSKQCFTMATEAACNSFIMQMDLARQMILGGTAKYALLVQTCNVSPMLPMDQAHSAWFGDACTAEIIGPVAEGRGILASAHRTVGDLHRTIVAGVPDRCWYQDGGKLRIYSADHEGARRMFLELPDYAAEVTGEALANGGLAAADVDFFAPHQATRWMLDVTKKHLRLVKARSVETFSWGGSMFGSNIPMALSVGAREGTLRDGDTVLMFAGGAGSTYSSILMRWGR
jgi:3-oxoacyl-[acyl-carrier-protein] synthase III